MTHDRQADSAPGMRFNEWFENFQSEQTLLRIRNIRRGLLRREDKITILEGLLYERIRDGEDCEDLMQALALLQENKIQDDRLYNSPIAQINGVIAFLMAVGLAATVFSFISSPFCGGSRSKFCEGARIIPEYVWGVFKEPAKQSAFPAREIPAHIKALD